MNDGQAETARNGPCNESECESPVKLSQSMAVLVGSDVESLVVARA